MFSTGVTGDGRCFCVVIHDVAPVFAAEIKQILDQLQPLLGNRFSAAVVPCWQGRHPDSDDCRQFQIWAERCGELLLHGWTHHRQHRPGLVSWLTGCSDEFSGMTRSEARLRVTAAQSQMKLIFGAPLSGFVAPAWQFPGTVADIQEAEIEYLMGFQRLESHLGESIPLATWSWDWGWLPGTSRVGPWLGTVKQACCRAAIPAIVLHPVDVHRRRVTHALRLIGRFLQAGWQPVLPSSLVRGVTAGVRK